MGWDQNILESLFCSLANSWKVVPTFSQSNFEFFVISLLLRKFHIMWSRLSAPFMKYLGPEADVIIVDLVVQTKRSRNDSVSLWKLFGIKLWTIFHSLQVVWTVSIFLSLKNYILLALISSPLHFHVSVWCWKSKCQLVKWLMRLWWALCGYARMCRTATLIQFSFNIRFSFLKANNLS